MFIPRSTARLRLARLVFLGLALVPTAVVGGWAAYLRSAAHRHEVGRMWQRVLGVAVEVDAVEHPRPGVVRVGDCEISDPEGRARVSLPGAEVETTATEVRLRVRRLRCDAPAARLLATLAHDWLARGQRFDRDCVIEIDDFGWTREVDGAGDAAAVGLRVECVATSEARAVRVVRRRPGVTAGSVPVSQDPGGGVTVSEVRVVRTQVPAAVTRDAPGADRGGGVRVTVSGTCAEPIPFEILAALADATSIRGWSLGPAARVTGRLDLACDERGWEGDAAGRVDAVDLATCGSAVGVPAAGTGMVDIRSLRWSAGRLAACELECVAGPGQVAREFLDALVTTLGCRAAVAADGGSTTGIRGFSAAGALVRIDGEGLELVSAPGLGGAIVIAAGEGIVWPPPGPVAVERLAWLVAPPEVPRIPAGGPGAWLMSIMPRGDGDRAARPVEPGQPRPF